MMVSIKFTCHCTLIDAWTLERKQRASRNYNFLENKRDKDDHECPHFLMFKTDLV